MGALTISVQYAFVGLTSSSGSYHTDRDLRIPTVFICFNCRIRGDKNWAMIAVNDLLPNMISKFNDLALFRYAHNRHFMDMHEVN
jgi:hypothetical protein